MALREQFTEQLKAAMLAKDAARVSTLRMITARVKDIDIAARPKGIDRVGDDDILAALRGMVKSRRESVALSQHGHPPQLVAEGEAERAGFDAFLPHPMDQAA